MSYADPNQRRSASLAELFASLWRHRGLILQLSKRDVISRYRGSVIGLAWSFFNPLLMLAVYTFVFSVVFNARWGSAGAGTTDFAVFLFVGMVVHGVFSECANRAPSLVLANASYVKRVVFPLEILPGVAMGSALFHAAISLVILFGAIVVLDGVLTPMIVLFPLVLLPLVVLTMGVSWFLAAMGVFVRDIGHVVGIITTTMLFLSPVFYPLSAMPEQFRPLILLNPLTFIIEQSRSVLILGTAPNWWGLSWYALASLAVAWLGFWFFQRMRRGFADVL